MTPQRPARRLGPLSLLLLGLLIATGCGLCSVVIFGQTLPNVPPIDLVGPLAQTGDCQSTLVNGYSMFIRNNIARSFRGTPVPCRGQHVPRPVGNRPNPNATKAYLIVWVIDPAVPTPGMVWTDPTQPATVVQFAGAGLQARVRLNDLNNEADGTGDTGGLNYNTDGGGLLTRAITKNTTYTLQLRTLPGGYVIPAEFAKPKSFPVTDKDVLVVIEAIRPR